MVFGGVGLGARAGGPPEGLGMIGNNTGRNATPGTSATEPAGRVAGGVSAAALAGNLRKIRHAMVQAEGIERMILDGRYCADVIVRINAVRSTLRVVAKALLRDHLAICHAAALSNGGTKEHDMYGELLDLASKMEK